MWINYPHMPTGANAQKNTFKKLIAWAKENDILLVNDNPYSFVLTKQPQSLLSITGAMEVALGLGLIIPRTRKYAGLLMALFLVAVYWANLNMWINNVPLEGKTFEGKWHVLRLIAQVMMIGVALWVGNWLERKNNIFSKSESRIFLN